MNKAKDLRPVKTQQAIKRAFFQQLRSKPLEKIRVSDICESALINRSTFYRHYPDIYILHQSMKEELIAKMVAALRPVPLFEASSDFFVLLDTLTNETYAEEKWVLFQGHMEEMFEQLQLSLLREYSAEISATPEYIRQTYAIGGAFNVCLRFWKAGLPVDTEYVFSIISQLTENLTR